MKIQIQMNPQLQETEVTICCSEIDENVLALQKTLLSVGNEKRKIACYREETEIYISVDEILFFETSGSQVWAHTARDSFLVRYKLYELENQLPSNFVRVSKSAILNAERIYSITRNLTASSKVEFSDSPKSVYVSRSYYKLLKDKISPDR